MSVCVWVREGNSEDANHFVYLIDLRLPPQCNASECSDVRQWALRRGKCMVPTQASGDCAVDVMALRLGLERSPATWTELRHLVAEWTREAAGNAMWRRVYAWTGELPEKLDAYNPSTRAKSLVRIGYYLLWNKKRRSAATSAKPGDAVALGAKSEAQTHALAEGMATASEGSQIDADGTDRVEGKLKSETDECLRAIAWSIGCPCRPEESPPLLAADTLRQADPSSVALMLRGYREHRRAVDATEPKTAKFSTRAYKNSTIEYRRKIGKTIKKFLESDEGKAAKKKRKYWQILAPALGWAAEAAVPVKVSRFWKKCLTEYVTTGEGHNEKGGRGPAGTAVVQARGKGRRFRMTGLQGHPRNSEELWSALFHHFVDNRRYMKGRCGPMQLKPMAHLLQEAITAALLAAGKVPSPINLNNHGWWARWKKWGRISYKKPTRKFKTTLIKFMARSRVYLHGLFLLRWFMVLAFGVEPRHEQADQKGVQVNQATSKNEPTLEFDAVKEVTIKDNAMQSRERVSQMTMTFGYNRAEVPDPDQRNRLAPLELLGRWTDDVVRRVTAQLPPGDRYSAQGGPKGSYREKHMITWIHRHLSPWTPARAAAHDIRVLGIDSYQVHNMLIVMESSWEYGYVRWGPPGGTTDAWSTNDTDLHAPMDRKFVQWNTASATAQLRARPGKVPTESPESVTNACIGIYEAINHDEMEANYKKRGLTNALDGTEDKLMAQRQRSIFYHPKVNGPALRTQAKVEVEAFLRRFRKEEITYALVHQLVYIGRYDEDPECDGTSRHTTYCIVCVEIVSASN